MIRTVAGAFPLYAASRERDVWILDLVSIWIDDNMAGFVREILH